MTREKPDYIEKSREAVWDTGERAIVKSLDATIEKLESSTPEITSMGEGMTQLLERGWPVTLEQTRELREAFQRDGAPPSMVIFSAEAFTKTILSGAVDRMLF
jgi:hypothetical protein